MGESTNPRATLRFDRRIRLEFRGATITSDAGLLACRELDGALGLTETASECLQESRGGRNVQHRLVGLLRQSVYSRLAGHEDTNDAERLADDPTMRVVVGRRGGPERPAASTNTMSRFETEALTQDGNVEGLGRLNAKWVDGAMSRTPHRRVILDMDSSESPVHGEQEGASYNGHFGSMCYHRSTSSVTARARCSVRGTYIVHTSGGRCWIRSCRGTPRRDCGGTFVPTPHSLSRTSMRTSRSGESSTQYGCRATKCCNGRSLPC